MLAIVNNNSILIPRATPGTSAIVTHKSIKCTVIYMPYNIRLLKLLKIEVLCQVIRFFVLVNKTNK